MQKLHLGCGDIALKGWINLDIDSPVADVLHDLTKPLPFDDGSVRYIFAEHMIEHIEYAEAENLLSECRRVLAPGGVVRMTTPDLAWLATTYLSSITNLWGDLWQPRSPCALLNEGMRSWGHRYLYDRAELRALFLSCGFKDVVYRDWRSSDDPALTNLESRPYNQEIITEARISSAASNDSTIDTKIIFPPGGAIDLLIVEQRQELDNLRLAIEAKEAQISQILSALGERDSRIFEVTKQLSRMKDFEEKLVEESRGLREVVIDRTAVIASQSALLKEKDERIKFCEKAIEDLARHVQGLEAGIEDRDTYIRAQASELTRVVAESSERVKFFENSIEDLTRHVQGLDSGIKDRDRYIGEQLADIERIFAESSERASLIESLRLRAGQLESESASQAVTINALQNELGYYQGIVEKLKQNMSGRFALSRLNK